ncbi:MAG: hypothetical protein PWP57_796 [Candidatus Atribacteria bacterium]|nr:hypothetical protein [Candidatus Atribacteria bacterium]
MMNGPALLRIRQQKKRLWGKKPGAHGSKISFGASPSSLLSIWWIKERFWTDITFPLVIPTVFLKVLHLNILASYGLRGRWVMPVRSLNSSVLKWPRREEAEEVFLS